LIGRLVARERGLYEFAEPSRNEALPVPIHPPLEVEVLDLCKDMTPLPNLAFAKPSITVTPEMSIGIHRTDAILQRSLLQHLRFGIR